MHQLIHDGHIVTILNETQRNTGLTVHPTMKKAWKLQTRTYRYKPQDIWYQAHNETVDNTTNGHSGRA